MLELSWDPATQIGILKWLSVAPYQIKKQKSSAFFKTHFFSLRREKLSLTIGEGGRGGKVPYLSKTRRIATEIRKSLRKGVQILKLILIIR
jgi:hypothetical protein